MTLQLTPEIEEVLNKESSAIGLSPAELTLHILANYAHNRPRSQSNSTSDRTVLASALPGDHSLSLEVLQQRREAGKRLFALRDKLASRGVKMPDEPAVRDWLHKGHRY